MGIYRDVTDEAAAEVARAVSDIYASKLQITGALQAAPQWAFARGETSTPDAD